MGPHFLYKTDLRKAACKTGKVYAFLFGFLTVDFVLALRRYYGFAFAEDDAFTKGRIGTAWKTGKFYDFIFGFLTVDFVLALHAAAKRL